MELKDVPLFEGLNEAELESVQKCLHEKHFSKGDLLFFEGNACQRVFIIKKGRVKLFQTTDAAREQILQSFSAGETCACHPASQPWICSATAQAMNDCDVWFFSVKDFAALIEKNSKLSHRLNEIFAQKMQCFSKLIEELSLKDVKKRLIKFLLDMLDERQALPGAKDVIHIPYTREEIAQRLGTTRETIARYLSDLKKHSLIEIKPYQIEILEKEELKKLLSLTEER